MSIEQSIESATRICAGDAGNYLVGGNLCNAFALGEVGSPDDFFLVGAPVDPGNGYPVITANLLDSTGKPLVRIVGNVIVDNPGKCVKTIAPFAGYEVKTESGQSLLKVQTTYLQAAGQYVTALEGDFAGKRGETVAALGADGLSFGKSATRIAMGFTPAGFGMGMNLSPEMIEAAKWCLASGGMIHRVVRGEIADQELNLDGKLFIDATIRNCRLIGSSLDFAFSGKIHLDKSQIHFDGQAAQVFRLAQLLMAQAPGAPGK
ncbi:MAG TPA: hypothetical protein VG326_19110 [Tepidisphaeraceae bacterium]|jgi:hypothetical protein|nr:hypothetical protein [Tepidisphaeraceae bacterium]